MKKIGKKILGKKNLLIGLLVLFIAAFLVLPNVSSASIESGILSVISWTVFLVIGFLGNLLGALINFTLALFEYNNFINAQAVEIGWVLVRDLSNMFFVVFLLVIAFSTILKISSYNYKSSLPKILLMAVLVNFSKTIMGFLVDFGQVIMLTFVNAFSGAGAGVLVDSLKLLNTSQIEDKTGTGIQSNEVLFALLLGLVVMGVSIGVMLAYVAVLLYRIIVLWVLILLSPLAFVLSAFQGTAKYAGEYWSEFWKQLTTGIILAFFIWLSFSILTLAVKEDKLISDELIGKTELEGGTQIGLGWDETFTVIVSIALLLIALQYAQKAGGFAGAFAGKVSGKLSQIGTGAVKLGAKGIGKGFKFAGGEAVDKIWEKTGFLDLNMKRNWARLNEGRQSRKKSQFDRATMRGDVAAREGNFLTARMAMATTGLADHYERYGAWKGLGKLVPGFGKVGKSAQEESDKRFQEANELNAEAEEYRTIANAGGANVVYLTQRNNNISQDREVKQERLRELEVKEQRGILDSTELTEKNDLEKQIQDIKREELKLQVHLAVKNIDFNADDAGLDGQIVQFRNAFQAVVAEEKQVRADIANLKSQRSGIMGNKPEDQAKKNQLSEAILALEGNLSKISDQQSVLLEARRNYNLDQYDNEAKINPAKLSNIRKRAQRVKEVDIAKLADAYRQNKISELKSRLTPDIEGADRKAIENQIKSLEIQSQSPAYLDKKGKDDLIKKSDEKKAQRDQMLKQASQYRPTVGFGAQRIQRQAEAEEMEKVKNVDNDEELINMYREAQLSRNHSRMAAILKKLANDGNFNEILKAYHYSADYKGSKAFFVNEVQGKGGYDEQHTISLGNDVGFINELKNGHYGMSRLSTMKNGRWQWMSEEQHAQVRSAQLLKKGSREIANKHNRLAFGGEDTEGNFHIDLGGAVSLRQIAPNWATNERLVNEQMNPNLANNLLSAELKFGELTKIFRGQRTSDGRALVDVVVPMLKKKLGSMNNKMETLGNSVEILRREM